MDCRRSAEIRSAMEKLEYSGTDEVDVLAVDRPCDRSRASGFAEHSGVGQGHLAGLREPCVGLRPELDVHGVTGSACGHVDTFGYARYIAIEQQSHRWWERAIRLTSEQTGGADR